MDILSIVAGLFLIGYGLGVIGWPYDVTRGIRPLERMSRRTRSIIGGVIIAAGLFMATMAILVGLG